MKLTENLNLKKRAASLTTAFVLMLTPIMARGESKNNKTIKINLVRQEDREADKTLTIEKFEKLVGRCIEAAESFKYPNMEQDIQNLCYLVNHTYMNENDGTEKFLIDNGFVTPVNPQEGMFEGIISANNFMNVRANYNQGMIRETNDPSKLFDLSVLCYDESDKEILHEAFTLWVNSHLNNTFDDFTIEENEDGIRPIEESNLYALFKLLTTLNRNNGKRNIDDASVGARFVGQLGYGNDSMQVIRDYLSSHYSTDELSMYFVKSELVRKQFVRNDREVDNCTLLGWLVNIFDETQYYCLEQCLPDLLKSFETTTCKTK